MHTQFFQTSLEQCEVDFIMMIIFTNPKTEIPIESLIQALHLGLESHILFDALLLLEKDFGGPH